MKELNIEQEKLMEDFAYELMMVDTVEDMFPPDTTGVQEPRRPLQPILPSAEMVSLAAVYDLAVARENRRAKVAGSGLFLRNSQRLLELV